MLGLTMLDEQIREHGLRAISDHVFPGCQVAYERAGRQSYLPLGTLTYDKQSAPVNDRTLYDVASITKSIPTSSIILKLAEEGRIGLDDPAITYLPELQNDYREDILIRHLLTFTVCFKLPTTMAEAAKRSPEALIDAIVSAPLAAPPGTIYVYTNAPSLLLGLIAERICGKALEEIARSSFFDPLKMHHTTFDTSRFNQDNIAPSAVEEGDELRGIPHDPGARALHQLGLQAGHAGLFSTAADLLIFARMLMAGGTYDGREYLRQETVAAMHTNQLEGGQKTGLGWMIDHSLSMGKGTSEQAFCRTGFTGTMILIDPLKQRALVFLSNRTYPDTPDSYDKIRGIWREMADLVFSD